MIQDRDQRRDVENLRQHPQGQDEATAAEEFEHARLDEATEQEQDPAIAIRQNCLNKGGGRVENLPPHGHEQHDGADRDLQGKGRDDGPGSDRPAVGGEQDRDRKEQRKARAGMEQSLGHRVPSFGPRGARAMPGRAHVIWGFIRNGRTSGVLTVKLRRNAAHNRFEGIQP